jgi:hypothetical protein
VRYSVPHGLIGERVWVRVAGEEVIVVHIGPHGPVEVARHAHSSRLGGLIHEFAHVA